MRFHVVGLPFAPQPQCAYSNKVTRFVAMMRERGHTVHAYECPADMWDPERRFDPTTEHWANWNKHATQALLAAVEPQDFICVIAGLCQEPIAARFPEALTVEFGVGYAGVFAPFRVFESYAWMHAVYGAYAGPAKVMEVEGRFYDAVIPNYFDVADFPEGQGDGDYYAFVGRMTQRKGVTIATDVCAHLGVPLVLAGEGEIEPAYGNHLGVIDPPKRAEVMGGATAVFVPTLYVEPFGGVAAEAMLCGTPVITTDWGAFTETVVDGVTGFRCRTLAEFADAAHAAKDLDRATIRAYALSKWTYAAVGPQYERFFQRLAGLWGQGWNAMPERVTHVA